MAQAQDFANEIVRNSSLEGISVWEWKEQTKVDGKMNVKKKI